MKIDKVIKVKKNSIVTESGKEMQVPFDTDGLKVKDINEWLEYYVDQIQQEGNE